MMIEERLADLKVRQEAGELITCHRCGESAMRKPAHTNALSRHADLYICSDCGMDEAMRDFVGDVLPLTSWAAMRIQER